MNLEGVRVLELAHLVAGPLVGAQLADLGATVIKVEPPTGDRARQLGSVRVTDDQSAVFATLNRNKRSVVLDLNSRDSTVQLAKLIVDSDVLIHNFRSRAAERFGLASERLRSLNPRLIELRITGFGSSGPHSAQPAVDVIVQAMSGLMGINGFPDRPVKVGFTVVDIGCGYLGTQAVLAALYMREHTGQGDSIEIALYDVALSLQMLVWADYLETGVEPLRTGNSAQLGSPVGLFETRDGSVVVSAYFPEHWSRVCTLLGVPELISDTRFATNALRLVNREELHALIEPRIRRWNTAEMLEALQRADVTCAQVLSYPQVESDPQTALNGIIVSAPTTREAPIRMIAYPARFRSGLPALTGASPGLGADTVDVLREARAPGAMS